MSLSNSAPTELTSALKQLKVFSCLEQHPLNSEAEKEQLRQAILLVVRLADYHNLGICADNGKQSLEALAVYLCAFGYPVPPSPQELDSIEAPIYVKFNLKKQSLYWDSYSGEYRGVLISCQSSEYDELNGTFGHFPLDLFTAAV